MQEAALPQAKPAPPSDVDKAPRVSPPARSAQSYLRGSNDPIAPEDNDLTIWDNRRAQARRPDRAAPRRRRPGHRRGAGRHPAARAPRRPTARRRPTPSFLLVLLRLIA